MATAILQNRFKSLLSRKRAERVDRYVFGQKVGLIAKLFGCWHENLSRPFGSGRSAYRACLNCGARKRFNTETLETYGTFYFPPTVKEEQV
jgi:DNA-directed RNA polymerase specialized sigma24 family protein